MSTGSRGVYHSIAGLHQLLRAVAGLSLQEVIHFVRIGFTK